jgi:hypothetical protein
MTSSAVIYVPSFTIVSYLIIVYNIHIVTDSQEGHIDGRATTYECIYTVHINKFWAR